MSDDEKDIFEAAAAAAGLDDEVNVSASVTSSVSAPPSVSAPIYVPQPSSSTFRTNLSSNTFPSSSTTTAASALLQPRSASKVHFGSIPPPKTPLFSSESFRNYREHIESLSDHSSIDRQQMSASLPSATSALPQASNKADIASLEARIKLMDCQLKESIRLFRLATISDPSDAGILRDNISLRTQLLEAEKRQLLQMQEISNRNRTRFPIPEDSNGVTPLKSLLEIIPRSGDLYTVLTRISAMSLAQNLSHRDVRILLINSLQGDALAFYHSMVELPLPEILTALERRFLEKDSVSTYNRKLALFKRKTGESLEQALERARFLVRHSASAFLPEDRPGREKSLVHTFLLRCVSPSTARYLSNAEEKALIEGRVLSIEELCLIAESIESLFQKDSPALDFAVENLETEQASDTEVNEVQGGILRPARLQAPSARPAPEKINPTPTRMSRSRSRDPRDDRRLERQSRSRERRQSAFDSRRSSSVEPRDVHMSSPTRSERPRSFSRPSSASRSFSSTQRRAGGYDFRPDYERRNSLPPRYEQPYRSMSAIPRSVLPPASYWPPMTNTQDRDSYPRDSRRQRPPRYWQGPPPPIHYWDRQWLGHPFVDQRIYCAHPHMNQWGGRQSGYPQARGSNPRSRQNRFQDGERPPFGRDGSMRNHQKNAAAGARGFQARRHLQI